MNRERVRRSGVTATIAAFALIALVACGGESVSEGEHEVTRVPTMSDAAAQATSDAASAATAEAAGTPVTASPAAGAATPVSTGAASPVAATPVAGAATAEAPAAAGSTAAEPVTVVSHDIFFEPKEFTVPADTDVTVSLPNEGVTLHNFSIDAINLSVDIDPGATEEAVINLPAGTYEFYCNVPGHKAAGMFGTLTVGE